MTQSEPLTSPLDTKIPTPGDSETVRFCSDGPPLLLLRMKKPARSFVPPISAPERVIEVFMKLVDGSVMYIFTPLIVLSWIFTSSNQPPLVLRKTVPYAKPGDDEFGPPVPNTSKLWKRPIM